MRLGSGQGGDSSGCYGVKEDSLPDPRVCFFLSLHVCAQPVDVCMFPTVAVPAGGSVGRALIPEAGRRGGRKSEKDGEFMNCFLWGDSLNEENSIFCSSESQYVKSRRS